MRMRTLSFVALYDIEEGSVIKFKFPDGHTQIGVVYKHVPLEFLGPVLHCNEEGSNGFIITAHQVKAKNISFSILKKHSPIAQFGENKTWDFVSNHQS